MVETAMVMNELCEIGEHKIENKQRCANAVAALNSIEGDPKLVQDESCEYVAEAFYTNHANGDLKTVVDLINSSFLLFFVFIMVMI